MSKCGTCTMCCILPELPELAKPINKVCNHCMKDKGCAIYPLRPKSCQTYQCVWSVKNLHESLRPDKCGVIFEMLSNKTFLAITNELESWRKGLTRKLMNEILKDGISIVVIIPGYQTQVLLSKDRSLMNIQEELNAALKVHAERVKYGCANIC